MCAVHQRARLQKLLVAWACATALAAVSIPSHAQAPAPFSKEWVAQQLAREKTVNLYWPGAQFRKWYSDRLIPSYQKWVKETYGVDVDVRVLSTGGGDASFFQMLTAYEEANPGGGKTFSIDVVRTAPTIELMTQVEKGWFLSLLPDHQALLPAMAGVNRPGLDIFTYERKVWAVPVYQPTTSMFYNAEKVPNPPKSLDALRDWIKANPRRFTYEDPRTGTGIGSGSLFLISVMRHYGDVNEPNSWSRAWAYLKEIQPHVYPQPTTGELMLELLRRGEVYLMPFWNDWGLFAKKDLNIPFMQNYFLQDGHPLRNTPLAVPRSAAHPIGALLFINHALTDAMQRDIASSMRQIPSSLAQGVWQGLPQDTFGFDLETIKRSTFAAFNSRVNMEAIQQMSRLFGPQVLGK